jgi:galacturonokinase
MKQQHEVIESLRSAVVKQFAVPPGQVGIVRAPYRICPLGAHIDHQLGPVTAMAIDRGVLLAFAPLAERRVRMISWDFPGEIEFALDAIPPKIDGDWGNFPRGAARALQQLGPLPSGLVGISSGRLDGGGLSSSAAIGVACLLALEQVNGLSVAAKENISLHSRIENDYLGLRIGILDQAAILLSRGDHLTWIDCATADHRLYAAAPEMPPFRLLIAFSGLKQTLALTGYNRRVAECREAARVLLEALGRRDQPAFLGNVSNDEFRQHRHRLDAVSARRAEHFFSEAARVEQAVNAWSRGDLAALGRLMVESGWSSIRNYECGSPPLIDLFQILVETPGVLGARFSGAGFRGCCVALVDDAAADQAREMTRDRYARAHPALATQADTFLCASADGAELLM